MTLSRKTRHAVAASLTYVHEKRAILLDWLTTQNDISDTDAAEILDGMAEDLTNTAAIIRAELPAD